MSDYKFKIGDVCVDFNKSHIVIVTDILYHEIHYRFINDSHYDVMALFKRNFKNMYIFNKALTIIYG
jgi:hypothetical protein